MSDQVMPTNPAGGGEQPASVRPEDLQTVPAVESAPGGAPAAGPETAPAPGSSPPLPAAAASQTPAAQPKLSPDDVAAAIAAVPGGAKLPANASAVPVPATAGDVDVIEPEWVNKADEVVRTHQGDPYGEEEGIEELQEDYLQKRYGISVKDADNAHGAPGGAADKPKGP